MADNEQTETFTDDRIMKLWAEEEQAQRQKEESARRRHREEISVRSQLRRAAGRIGRESIAAHSSSQTLNTCLSSPPGQTLCLPVTSPQSAPLYASSRRSAHASDGADLPTVGAPLSQIQQSGTRSPPRSSSNLAQDSVHRSAPRPAMSDEYEEDEATYVYVPPARLASRLASHSRPQHRGHSSQRSESTTRVDDPHTPAFPLSINDDPDWHRSSPANSITHLPCESTLGDPLLWHQQSQPSVSTTHSRMPWAGRGWISPHPLSEATSSWISAPQSHIVIYDPRSGTYRKLTYDEWLALPSIEDELAGTSRAAFSSSSDDSATSDAWQSESRHRGEAHEASTSARDPYVRTIASGDVALSTFRTASTPSGQRDGYMLGTSISRHSAGSGPRQLTLEDYSNITIVNGCEFMRLRMPWDLVGTDSGHGGDRIDTL